LGALFLGQLPNLLDLRHYSLFFHLERKKTANKVGNSWKSGSIDTFDYLNANKAG